MDCPEYNFFRVVLQQFWCAMVYIKNSKTGKVSWQTSTTPYTVTAAHLG